MVVLSRSALTAEETHDGWVSVWSSVTAESADPGVAACPNCGRFRIQFQYVAEPSSRIGFCALWCTSCFHGHVLSRVKAPSHLSFLRLDADPGELERAIPGFVDVAAEQPTTTLDRPLAKKLAALRPCAVEYEFLRALTREAEQDAVLGQLAPREREVALLLTDGRTRQEVATALGLSRSTVQSLIERIYWKLGHEIDAASPRGSRRSGSSRRRTS